MAERVDTDSTGLTPLRVGIVVLALATAVIHIVLAIPQTLIAFYLNGLGYVGLTAAFLLPRLDTYHRQIGWLLMGYTALTILLWVVLGQPYTTIGYIDKAVELALLALLGLLWLDQRRSSKGNVPVHLADTAR